MTYYVIDFENVHAEGLSGIDTLSPEDTVCIFYRKSSTLSFDMIRLLLASKAKMQYYSADIEDVGIFRLHLASYAGFLLASPDCTKVNIVSNEKSFCQLGSFWEQNFNDAAMIRSYSSISSAARGDSESGASDEEASSDDDDPAPVPGKTARENDIFNDDAPLEEESIDIDIIEDEPAPAVEMTEEETADEPSPANEITEEETIDEPSPANEIIEEETIGEPSPANEIIEEETIGEPSPANEIIEEETIDEPAPANEIIEEETIDEPAPVSEIIEEETIDEPAPAAENNEAAVVEPSPEEWVIREPAADENAVTETAPVPEAVKEAPVPSEEAPEAKSDIPPARKIPSVDELFSGLEGLDLPDISALSSLFKKS